MFTIVPAFKNGGPLYLHTGYTVHELVISIFMRPTDNYV